MRLEIRRINHDGLGLSLRGRQAIHHPHKNAHGAPTFPAVVERFVRTVFPGRITPTHTIAIHKNDAAQHAAVINSEFTMALRKKGPQTLHLFIRQLKQVAHLQSPHRA